MKNFFRFLTAFQHLEFFGSCLFFIGGKPCGMRDAAGFFLRMVMQADWEK